MHARTIGHGVTLLGGLPCDQVETSPLHRKATPHRTGWAMGRDQYGRVVGKILRALRTPTRDRWHVANLVHTAILIAKDEDMTQEAAYIRLAKDIGQTAKWVNIDFDLWRRYGYREDRLHDPDGTEWTFQEHKWSLDGPKARRGIEWCHANGASTNYWHAQSWRIPELVVEQRSPVTAAENQLEDLVRSVETDDTQDFRPGDVKDRIRRMRELLDRLEEGVEEEEDPPPVPGGFLAPPG